MLQASTLSFLSQLRNHNHKEWFDANRKQYDAAKADFAGLVQTPIDKHGKKDPDIAPLLAKECVFRINRDVRFSKDKAPYKTNFGASIDRGGKKSIYAGYYLHCEPGNQSFVGGGLWMPEAPNLAKIRQEIDYCFGEFSGILQQKAFVKQYGQLDTHPDWTLTRPPKGYEADNPAIEYLKLKSILAIRPLTDEELTSKKLEETLLTAFEALQPLLGFLNRALE